jgi:hypothetical protein
MLFMPITITLIGFSVEKIIGSRYFSEHHTDPVRNLDRTLWITEPPATNWSGNPSQCPCGQEQMPYRILQDCPLFEVQRQQTWPDYLDTQIKLWGQRLT